MNSLQIEIPLTPPFELGDWVTPWGEEARTSVCPGVPCRITQLVFHSEFDGYWWQAQIEFDTVMLSQTKSSADGKTLIYRAEPDRVWCDTDELFPACPFACPLTEKDHEVSPERL